MANPKKDQESNLPKDVHTLTVFLAVNEHGVFRLSAVQGAKGESTRLENVESRSIKRFRQSAPLALEAVIDQIENAWKHYLDKQAAEG